MEKLYEYVFYLIQFEKFYFRIKYFENIDTLNSDKNILIQLLEYICFNNTYV